MSRRLDFDRDAFDWPHREASRFVRAGGLRWHVQIMGDGPAILLLHGTGASTHSFRALAPLLARHHRVVLPDLPAHGFTGRPAGRLTMPRMSDLVGELLAALDIAPTFAAGHSAGAAILARMALDERARFERIASLNGALLPFPGLAAELFPGLAKLLFLNPVAPRFFSWRARGGHAVDRLMTGTGSRIDAAGVDLYRRLLSNRHHVEGVLSMMANWDLDALRRDLPRLAVPLDLIVGDRDRAIPPEVSRKVASLVPHATLTSLAGLGHLAHEEAPDRVFAALREATERQACAPV